MNFNPIEASTRIMRYYLRYIETAFFINDADYFRQFQSKLRDENYFAKGPYLEATDSFRSGKSLQELIDEGEISPLFAKLNPNAMPLTRPLYLHQERSIRCLNRGGHAVITTGTGSGKTESFLLPILNALFREQEAGTISPGVRALLIYPMNALANDQVKRLRSLLQGTRITFGAYTGETENLQSQALVKYRKLNQNSEPMENELISREVIKETPPHLLITNYAMLEYLMIRPQDNSLFGGKYSSSWKFIVLDEAHTYTGATGIEVSMLLRRLKARLQTTEDIQYILTSATLGSDEQDNGDVIRFANTLCSVDAFCNENIIRASRVRITPPESTVRFPDTMYAALEQCIETYNDTEIFYETALQYDNTLAKEVTIEESVYSLLKRDERFYQLKALLDHAAVPIHDVIQNMKMEPTDIAAMISLASRGRKNGIALFDARYHYFIRTLEGAYLTLAPQKQLFISPLKQYQGSKVFQFSVCKSCGEIYMEGYTTQDPETGLSMLSSELTIFSPAAKQPAKEYFLLNSEKLGIQDRYTQETDLPDQDLLKNSYSLCGKCGNIHLLYAKNAASQRCDCGTEYRKNIVKIPSKYCLQQKLSNQTFVKHCICCDAVSRNQSVLRSFYMGQAAAASVIGTALYGAIPSHRTILHTTRLTPTENDPFGFAAVQTQTKTTKEDVKLEKQFLIFSDSRQEAAYFAGYFDMTYHNLLRRRILMEVLREHMEEYRGGVLPSVLCRHLEAAFSRHGIFQPDRRKEEAMITVLNEMVSDERNSLENLGVLAFRYAHPSPDLPVFPHGETGAVISILADGFRQKAALKYENITDLNDEDKLSFQYSAAVQSIALSKESQTERFSSRSTWTSVYGNRRTDYLARLSQKIHHPKWNKGLINRFLVQLWEHVFLQNESIESHDHTGYRMLIDQFVIHSSFSDALSLYQCSKCGKVTMHNAGDICPEYRCSGTLMPMKKDAFENNHYFRVYTELDISNLVVKEHTAQLDIETAKKYQDAFVRKEINVLSCSTTFEMGVDVGDLETVFMKNMPPTPANYIQRAGRAGRRTDSAAYALTFCKLSSHDLNFYRAPERMIKGRIQPPCFQITNEKIVKRHLNACCFASFFRKYPDSFQTVQDFLLSEYYQMFREYIASRPAHLMAILKDSIPAPLHGKIGEWLTDLTSEDGAMHQVYLQTTTDLEQLNAYASELAKSNQATDLHSAANIQNAIKTIQDTDTLSFLSRNSILPKYGFPVDSVELQTNPSHFQYRNTSRLRLSRDLSVAIAEYAPDSEVIADGKLYKSRYIRLPQNKNHVLLEYPFSICTNPECSSVNTDFSQLSKESNCRICGSPVQRMGSYIVPQHGFIAEPGAQKATTRRPERTYRGDVHYIGNSSGTVSQFALGDISVTITRTRDDTLLIMNQTPFYICRSCGYAYRKNGGINEAEQYNKDAHRSPSGKFCQNRRFDKIYLGHHLKTDVAIINISLPFRNDQAISVLYALLEGVSAYYSIERSDISGCLHYTWDHGKLHTIFVLYDTVPGGAGHISRISSGGQADLIGILQKAFRIVDACTCGGENGDGACYSCLCNYENQRIHDRLNRGVARDYIKQLLTAGII